MQFLERSLSESGTKTPNPFGSISFAGKDIAPQPSRYNRLAVGPKKELLMVSLVAETNIVKAIRAILGGGARADIKATGGRVVVPGVKGLLPYSPDEIKKTEELYDCHFFKLDHGLTHALFVTRTPGFMVVVSDEAVWKELTDIRFTTPILRDWLPYLRAELKSRGLLTLAACFNCECGMLTATTENLDLIVTDGLRSGKIHIKA